MSGVTLDAGALIALDRDDRRVIALIARTAERGMRVTGRRPHWHKRFATLPDSRDSREWSANPRPM